MFRVRDLPLIALEGIDKAGKGTQSKYLERRLTEKGCKVEQVAFPDYGTPVGKEIKMFLQGKISFRSEVRQLLYVANRWERQKDLEGWLKKGIFVVADRYVPSGIAYGLANGLDLDWILRLEEGLPVADIVILIDISPETSRKRGGKKDIYEEDRIFLERVRSCYLEQARRFGWIVIDGETNILDLSLCVWKNVVNRFFA